MAQHDTPSGADLRRWARQCGERASAALCARERESLLKMRDALLDLARTEDWLRGVSYEGHMAAEPCLAKTQELQGAA